jgi:hypothetical protein
MCSTAPTLRPPRSSPGRRLKTSFRARVADHAHVLQPYCNRVNTHWYTMDKTIPPDPRKPPKQAQFPDVSGQASMYASKLVTGAGQRFESARRLSFCLQNPQKQETPDDRIGGFVSSTSAVDFPKASYLALGCYKRLQGTEGGVGASSGVDPLTDMPEVRLVRHRRKNFARVPRRGILGTSPKRSSRKYV